MPPSLNPSVIDTATLKRISGKKTAAAIARWASRLGIKTLPGGDGPWTTLSALDKALGVDTHQTTYLPEDVI